MSKKIQRKVLYNFYLCFTAPANPSCHPGLFPCDGALCIPLAAVCDGHQDCYDGMDETNCNNFKRQYQVDEMSVDQKSINSSSFLLHWQIRTPEKIQLEFLPSIAEVKYFRLRLIRACVMTISYLLKFFFTGQ